MLVNGQQSDVISLLDRGLHYGDGLFETIAVVHHEMPLWDRHYHRLSRGCEQLGIEPPGQSLLEKEIRQLTEKSARLVVKLMITRGEGGKGYFPADTEATRVVLARPWPEYDENVYSDGIDLHLCETKLATGELLSGLKHLNRLEQVLAARETAEKGFIEGVVCDVDGYVVEGVASNLFWISEGQLSTPVIDRSGVAGVMREEVIDQANALKIPVHEVRATPDVLQEADALFLTNAVIGIVPVRSLADKEYKTDRIPGELLEAINTKIMKHDAE